MSLRERKREYERVYQLKEPVIPPSSSFPEMRIIQMIHKALTFHINLFHQVFRQFLVIDLHVNVGLVPNFPCSLSEIQRTFCLLEVLSWWRNTNLKYSGFHLSIFISLFNSPLAEYVDLFKSRLFFFTVIYQIANLSDIYYFVVLLCIMLYWEICYKNISSPIKQLNKTLTSIFYLIFFLIFKSRCLVPQKHPNLTQLLGPRLHLILTPGILSVTLHIPTL